MIELNDWTDDGGSPGNPSRSEAARRAWKTRRQDPGEGVPARERNKGYQKKYYSEHRRELSKKRKLRYRENAEYRDKIRERALGRYKKKREELEQERLKTGWTAKTRGYNRPRVMQIHGKDVLLHSPGEFADRMGVSVQTLGMWEERAILPAPTVKDERGRRWYERGYMGRVASIVREFKRNGGRSLAALKDVIAKGLSEGGPR